MVFIHVDSLQSLGPTMATGDSNHLGRVWRLGNCHAPNFCHFHREHEPINQWILRFSMWRAGPPDAPKVWLGTWHQWFPRDDFSTIFTMVFNRITHGFTMVLPAICFCIKNSRHRTSSPGLNCVQLVAHMRLRWKTSILMNSSRCSASIERFVLHESWCGFLLNFDEQHTHRHIIILDE